MPGTANDLNIRDQGIVSFDGISVFTGIAFGTSGQILTSNGLSSNPSFKNPSASSISITGDSGGALTGSAFTLTGGSTGLIFSGSGTTETLEGTLAIANGGTNASSFIQTNGIVAYNGSSLVNYTGPQLSSGGIYTNSSQPAFFAYLTNTISDVTGDGTLYTVVFDTVSQQGSGYDVTTGIFTAPSTGYYMFTYALLFTGVTAAQNTNFSGFLYNTNIATYPANVLNTTASTIADEISSTASIGHFMIAGDTMAINAQINGTGKIVSLSGIENVSPVDRFCTFTGVKVA